LDYSKEAWLNGKKAMYVMPDGSMDSIDVEPITHMESEYGIFVSDAGKDAEKRQKIEGLAQAAVQNGLPLSAAISIYESDSLAQIKDKIQQAEKQAEELRKAQEQAQQEQAQQEMQLKQQELQMQALDKEKDRQVQVETALIAAESNDKKSSATLEKMLNDFEIKQREISLKEQELGLKAQQGEQDYQIRQQEQNNNMIE
jgi:hypothetical protein